MSEQNIQRIETGGKRIILVGTAHISRESVALVERTIDEERPDTVCVELCRDRYEALRQQGFPGLSSEGTLTGRNEPGWPDAL